MTDAECILSELKLRATDSRHEQALTGLCQELIKTFEKHAAEGVASVIEAKMQPLRDGFDNAHRALMKKLGGTAGPGVHS